MGKKDFLEEEQYYIFDKLPENIKQIGEQPDTGRIYVEDYVVTYMHRIFREKAENSLVVFVGKRGSGAAQGSVFLYGAIEVELDILLWKEQFTAQVWDKIHEQVHQYFSGGEVLGWGCGVHIGSSQIKKAVAGIQRKHFSREGQVLFYWDYSEEEESVCRWENGSARAVPGYIIYYGKNPEMQEFMLRGKKKESFEAEYQDTVMRNVRTVIKNKEKEKREKKPALYVAGGMLLVLTILGGWLLLQSNQKIESLETAIMTLSQMPEETSSEEAAAKSSEPKKTSVPAGDFESFEEKSFRINSNSGSTYSPASAAPAPSAKGKEEADSKPANSASPSNKTEKAVSAPSSKKTAKPAATPSPRKTVRTSSVPSNKTGKASSTPMPSRAPENTKAPAQENMAKSSSYVVQKGDTLSQIVWRQYHTMACLEWIKNVNNIENENEIRVGQRIVLPVYKK